MIEKYVIQMIRPLLFVLVFLALGGCAPQQLQKQPRFFWPPPPGEAKIEYINFFFSDEDLLRGVDRRIEDAILGRRNPERVIKQPYSVASDGQGRIIVGDFAGKRVMILDQKSHGSRQLLEMSGVPQKVLVDKAGEIWALDGTSTIVFHFAADEKLLPELKLKGMNRASSLAVDSDRQILYLTDTPNHRICLYDYQGQLLKTVGVRGNGPLQFNYPTDLDLDRDGNLYVVDSMNARIQILSPDGTFIRSFGERGTEPGSFSTPKGIAVSPGQIVYVSDATQNKVVIFSAQGDYLLTLGGRSLYDGKNIHPGGFYFPTGIDIDANETIFIADFFNGMIHEFQYLTPDYLARNPILSADVYQPQPVDLQGDKESLPLPTKPGEEPEGK